MRKKYIHIVLTLIFTSLILCACTIDDEALLEGGKDLVETGKELLDTTVYDIDDETVFDENHEIFTGDLEKRIIGGLENADINVSFAGGTINIEVSEDEFFYIKGEGIEKLQAFCENGCVTVHGLRNTNMSDEMKVTLYIPAAFTYENVSLGLGAGLIEVENLSANNLELRVGAGVIKGNVAFQNSMTVNCDCGAVLINLPGTPNMYDYVISVSAGNISVGDESYTVVSRENVDNGSNRLADLSCLAGNVEIDFNE